jgi:L-ascorbate metabolism protein UlaG (beta-lactamase superfamily)
MSDILKWKFRAPPAGTPAPARWPRRIDIAPHVLPPRPADGSPGIVATWINHSTFLLQTAAATILTDPVFSRCCGPFGRLGPARVHAPGIALDALPRIDVVFLSHDHYDHCDLQSLRRIARRDSPSGVTPLGITPLGNGALLRRAGFAPERIIELDWWQTHDLQAHAPQMHAAQTHAPQTHTPPTHASQTHAAHTHTAHTHAAQAHTSPTHAAPTHAAPPGMRLRFTLTPSQHWSKRLASARNSRLWGGVHISIAGSRRIHFVGDTGYHAAIFRDIAARLGPPDLALIPIGAYEPRWFMRAQHCNPAEAVQIHRDLGSRQSVAMHWGTFQLTEEARDEPPRALAAALREAGIPPETFKVLEPGQSLTV